MYSRKYRLKQTRMGRTEVYISSMKEQKEQLKFSSEDRMMCGVDMMLVLGPFPYR